jgi:hypothetical protein
MWEDGTKGAPCCLQKFVQETTLSSVQKYAQDNCGVFATAPKTLFHCGVKKA